jgi:hypothetical protein
MIFTRRIRSSEHSTSDLMRMKCSSAVLNSCAEWTCNRSLSTNSPASWRTSMIAFLPFCRGTTTSDSNAAHLPSGRSSMEPSSRSRCQSSSSSPRVAARRSTLSSFGLATPSLGKRNDVGRAGGRLIEDRVNSRLPLALTELSELRQCGSQLTRDVRFDVCVCRLERRGELVTQRLQRATQVTAGTRLGERPSSWFAGHLHHQSRRLPARRVLPYRAPSLLLQCKCCGTRAPSTSPWFTCPAVHLARRQPQRATPSASVRPHPASPRQRVAGSALAAATSARLRTW